MGRGDKKTKKGKIASGSYGVIRSRKSIKSVTPKAVNKEEIKASKELEAKNDDAVAPKPAKKTATKTKATKAKKTAEKTDEEKTEE